MTGSSSGDGASASKPKPCPEKLADSPFTAQTPPGKTQSVFSYFAPEYMRSSVTFSSCTSYDASTYLSVSRRESLPPVSFMSVKRLPFESRSILMTLAPKSRP